MDTKKCTKCKKTKLKLEFHKRQNGKYVQAMCKECDSYFRKKREEKRLNRKIVTKLPNWSESEIHILSELYESHKIKEIAKIMGRSTSSISTKIWELGKSNKLKKWTKADNAFLKANIQTKSLRELSKILKRSLKAIKWRLSLLGIKMKKSSQLEIDFRLFLEQYGIEFEEQFKIWKYKADFYLEKYNLIIETHGDYWHCNPKRYTAGPLYKTQENNIERDARKAKYIKSKEYELLIIWEDDFYNNLEEVKKQLHVVLSRNGEDYDWAKSVKLPRDNTEVTNKQLVP